MIRAARLAAAALFAAVLALAVLALATARPGDPRLYPPRPGAASITIHVLDHGWHAGLALPRAELARAAEAGRLPRAAALARHFAAYDGIEVGWGDEGFYRLVPTAADLTLREAVRALLSPGNPSVLHAVGLVGPRRSCSAPRTCCGSTSARRASPASRPPSTRPSPRVPTTA